MQCTSDPKAVAKDAIGVLGNGIKIAFAVGKAIVTEGAVIDVAGIFSNSVQAVQGTVGLLAKGQC
jgi:hypothetical protein